jgi:hypothetical protein
VSEMFKLFSCAYFVGMRVCILRRSSVGVEILRLKTVKHCHVELKEKLV